MKTSTSILLLIFGLCAFAPAVSAQCADPWLNQAFATIGRKPNGSGSTGECAVNRYGGATWGNYGSNAYNVLLTWVRNSWACNDPWIGEAYASPEVNRPIKGSGASGECSPSLYGNWSSFADLISRIRIYQANLVSSGAAPSGPNPGDFSSACQMMYGRACDTNDQAAVMRNPGGWTNRDTIMNILRTQIAAPSPAIKDSIINNAIALIYGQNTSVCTEAWNFLRASFTPNMTSAPPSNWNSFQQLYYSINGQPPMLTTVVTNQCKGAAPRTPGVSFDTGIARAACQYMLGRDCSSDETAQLGSQVGGNNRDAMQNFIRDRWIAASPTYKDNVIAAAFAFVMSGKTICAEELNDLRARFFTNPSPGTSWNGFYSLAYAANGQAPLVQSRFSLCTVTTVALVRDSSAIFSMIVNSYQPDFGRDATQADKDYWASQRVNDPRVANRAAFQQNSRQHIRTDAGERQQMINHSYQMVFKRPPTGDESSYWDKQLQSSGMTYQELIASHTDYLKKNPTVNTPAPQNMNPSVDTTARKNIINQSYVSAFGRPPTSAQLAFWMALPSTDSRLASVANMVANHRTYLKTDAGTRRAMVNNSYADVFKRAPLAAEMTYWDGQVAKTGAIYDELIGYHKQYLAKQNVEECFGAVGKGCEGGGFSFYDGRSDLIPFIAIGCSPASGGYRNCWVAPGSIKHDNCCHLNPNGKMCGGPGPETTACANEWEMAVSDVLNHRLWIQTVPDGPSNLTPVTTTRVQTYGERAASAVLCGPGGTLISDYHGPQFCCSQRFTASTPMENAFAWGTSKRWFSCAVGPTDVYAGGQTAAGLPGISLPPPTPAEIQRVRR